MARFTSFLARFIWLLAVSPVVAQEAVLEVEGLTFREPFSNLSPSEIRDKLVVFLITDDDPLEWTKARLDEADKSKLGLSRDVWCGNDFRRSFQKLFVNRPDLKERCIAQRVAAGLPKKLTGGIPRTLPKRAIVVICDGQYRLLNFSVGVPDWDEILDQIEDAEEIKTLLNLHEDSPAKLAEIVTDRTKDRVRRVYAEALARLDEHMAGDGSLLTVDDPWIAKYARFVAELRESYLFDVKLRFGLSDASDLIRLLVLEQHCEARKAWCETVAPYVVGRPLQEFMSALVDTTWGVPAVIKTDKSEHEEVLRWFSTRRENSMIVLSVTPTRLDQDLVWPPPNVSRNPLSRLDWSALETAMSKHPFRTVTAEQLAVILNEHDEMPINLLAPVRARYVVFDPEKRQLIVIRENDSPGKFIKRL